jgi:type IV pilus assembly protein PilE
MHADRHKHVAGFSMVELLVVMVVASILMMVAVPSYQQAVIKSRRADGRIALNDVAQRLERCYSQFGAYDALDADGDPACGIVDGAEIDSKEGFYQVTVTLPDADDGTAYKLSAAPLGAQLGDTDCENLEINALGARSATGENTDHCW